MLTHKGTIQLETDRLILRRFVDGDAEAMFRNWANDQEVTKYLRWRAHENTEMTDKILTEWIPRYKNDDFYQWTIILKEESDEPIGTITVVDSRYHVNMVHIGYCIGRKWWNRGITSEALKTLIKFFFEEVGINRVEAQHDPNNPASGKVMMKCGMKYEGTMREADFNNQGICDAAMYAILRRDYSAALK